MQQAMFDIKNDVPERIGKAPVSISSAAALRPGTGFLSAYV